jgi:hypothetical protein
MSICKIQLLQQLHLLRLRLQVRFCPYFWLLSKAIEVFEREKQDSCRKYLSSSKPQYIALNRRKRTEKWLEAVCLF